MTREFLFAEQWTLPFPRAAVHDVLGDLEHYPEWWPQVVAVAKIDDDTARVLCRSALPYTLDLVLGAVHRRPELLETAIAGDLVGTVRWRLSERDADTVLDFEQRVEVGHRALAVVAVPLRRLLVWNHAQMMVGCRAGLTARLAGS